MKILFIGDIVGSPGRKAVKEIVPRLSKKEAIDFVIANAENAAGGSGITDQVADEIFSSGVDVLTSGDHIWKKREIVERLNSDQRILRPANYPLSCPGQGAALFKKKNLAIAVVNVVGRVFMEAVDSPFLRAKEEIDKIKTKTKVIIVDIHAEATSEKIALGWYLDGQVSAILGTHTHVPTADEKILPKGTAYISDVGMTGPQESVIGRRIEDILERFLTNMPVRFEVAEGDIELQGAILEIDNASGKALSIKRVREKLQEKEEDK
jgi:metallophosphoesterase (TIGR00282 family)